MDHLSDPRFVDVTAAREWLENQRWPNGPVCPHCGNTDAAKITGLKGKAHRPGVYQCNECREQFTVTVGSVMERSKIPLNKWVLAMHLMSASKKGMSAHQLHRMLGITYHSAWFLAHRIREAMRTGALAPFGGEGGVVEIDETFIGRKKGMEKRQAYHHKMAVLSLVHRESGSVRSFVVDSATADKMVPIVLANVDRETYIMTDESKAYPKALRNIFLGHGRVNHGAGEYGRGPVFTNTIEGYFSIFKRGMRGIYQFCGERHLHRYLAEFDFRYNNRAALGCNDADRADALLRGIVGKRLTYQTACARA